MKNWQRVYSTQQAYRAEIVRAVLTDAGLNPVVVNKQDSAYLFGFQEVYVAPEHVLLAIKIIEDEITFK
ncbi:Putative signal transducing protein [Catalinimonas alkaloidigena]|uniref:Putative signal transducing protein n=1 Tax=Catalinimonas alkaloidigena TaxID=1075417 RepID=A0A1G9F4W7_9BACT|nr:DUF2007 domain-containing protein [Catalinimonas alkaloidigena]SDK83426.1 Putative signal transducing protein [Catalinimonas alkaloidigena]